MSTLAAHSLPRRLTNPTTHCRQVVNIIIEPEATSQRFVVYGARQDKKTNKIVGVLVYVDFGNLHERACRGANSPGVDSDYEHWTPRYAGTSSNIPDNPVTMTSTGRPLTLCSGTHA